MSNEELLIKMIDEARRLQRTFGNDAICKYTSFQLCIEMLEKELKSIKK